MSSLETVLGYIRSGKYEDRFAIPVRADYPLTSWGGAEFAKDRAAYRKDSAQRYESFKQDCIALIGVGYEPAVAARMFDYAWQENHANGMEGVANTMDDLADLFRTKSSEPSDNIVNLLQTTNSRVSAPKAWLVSEHDGWSVCEQKKRGVSKQWFATENAAVACFRKLVS